MRDPPISKHAAPLVDQSLEDIVPDLDNLLDLRVVLQIFLDCVRLNLDALLRVDGDANEAGAARV